MKKRLIALLLTSVLTLSCFSGCGKTEKPALNIIDDNYRTCYEVFVYSFYDSDGDGIGDLPGLKKKLDYINDGDDTTDSDLGCNEIWLMPISPSPTYHKYDVIDYMDIDPEYGTMEDFDALIEDCHSRGVHVIIDFVMNHSSSEHPWFVAASDYLKTLDANEEPDLEACPYVDYYHFSREKLEGYTALPGSDWYYEARFWEGMPDLNLKSEAVRKEFDEITSFWLDHGVDGFRLDAVTSYETGQPDEITEELTWFNDMVKVKKSDAYIVGEAWTNRKSYAPFYASGVDSFFDFSFADSNGNIAKILHGAGSAADFAQSQINAETLYQSYNPNYINAPFYTNHDMARSSGFYTGELALQQTKYALAMNLLMQGNAFLYYGEELGMRGSGADENKRAPMQWSNDATGEGMCKGPANMKQQDMIYGSLEDQAKDSNSIYSFTKEVIRLRNTYPAIARGMTEILGAEDGEAGYGDSQICGIRRRWKDSDVAMLFNISPEDRTVAMPEGYTLVDWVNATDAKNAVSEKDQILSLPAYSIAILSPDSGTK